MPRGPASRWCPSLVTSARRGRETEYRLADEHVGHVLTDAINHVKES